MSGPAATGRLQPLWLSTIRQAKQEAFEALPEDEKRRALEDQAAWRARSAQNRKDKELFRRERFKQIMKMYFDAHTLDEIGAKIGMTAQSVRQFAWSFGVKLTRGPSERKDGGVLVRSVTLSRLQETALRRLADDGEIEPAQALSEVVAMALEMDAQVARRLMRVPRRARA